MKEETLIKNIITDAILSLESQTSNTNINFSDGDFFYKVACDTAFGAFDIQVTLMKATKLRYAQYSIYHPIYGIWGGNLNGGNRVGKPFQRFTVEEMKDVVKRGLAKPIWQRLGY